MRKRCKWETIETCKEYAFQKNDYEELRVTRDGKQWRTFHGQNSYKDAKHYWETVKTLFA